MGKIGFLVHQYAMCNYFYLRAWFWFVWVNISYIPAVFGEMGAVWCRQKTTLAWDYGNPHKSIVHTEEALRFHEQALWREVPAYVVTTLGLFECCLTQFSNQGELLFSFHHKPNLTLAVWLSKGLHIESLASFLSVRASECGVFVFF